MKWKAPTISVVCVGMEINMYANAHTRPKAAAS
jgi:coenzyme PQQ precursor peptide PqqA